MIISQNSKELNIKFQFSEKNISNNVNFTYFESFKHKINFSKLINNTITCKKHYNSTFKTDKVFDYIIDSITLGYLSFSHMNNLKNDLAYKTIKGYSLPDEKVCRDLLKNIDENTITELKHLNRNLLELKAKNEEIKEIMLDFDDTVCHIFGSQEGSAIGYNPKYKERPSYKVKVGMVAMSNELLDITLESGNHHSNHNFLSFLKNCISQLPSNWIVKRVRADKGMFDEKTLIYLEDNFIEYEFKAKMYKSLKQEIQYLLESHPVEKWTELNSTYSFAEINFALPKWERSRRFIIIKKSISKKQKELNKLKLFSHDYIYQAIVTNINYLSPPEIFKDYNQRCNVENKIDHLKECFFFSENSLKNKTAN